MRNINLLIATTLITGSIAATSPAFAVDEYNVSKGTTIEGNGVAFRGNDLVAALNGLGVVPGRAEFTHVHDGIAYYFASKDAQERFAAKNWADMRTVSVAEVNGLGS